jgi:hypothetical protein
MAIDAQIKNGINKGIMIIERYSVLLSKYNFMSEEHNDKELEIIRTSKLAAKKTKICKTVKEYNIHTNRDIIQLIAADSMNMDNCLTIIICR